MIKDAISQIKPQNNQKYVYTNPFKPEKQDSSNSVLSSPKQYREEAGYHSQRSPKNTWDSFMKQNQIFDFMKATIEDNVRKTLKDEFDKRVTLKVEELIN